MSETRSPWDRWTCVMLRMYPKAWRARYGKEMEALLEQHAISMKTVYDIGRGALLAQLFYRRRGLEKTQFVVGLLLITMVCVGSYGAIQQWLRHNANEPQLSIVQQISQDLTSHAPITSEVPRNTVNIRRSLRPFVIVYNEHGQVLASNARLHGRVPSLPSGVLSYTRGHGSDKITWQPEPDARIAAVIQCVPGAHGDFVLSGRALRVVENEENVALRVAEAAWLGVTAAFGATLVLRRNRRLRNPV